MTKLPSDKLNPDKMIFSGGDGKRLEAIPTIVKGLVICTRVVKCVEMFSFSYSYFRDLHA